MRSVFPEWGQKMAKIKTDFYVDDKYLFRQFVYRIT